MHDVESQKSGDIYNAQQAAADIKLIKELTFTDTSYDPEASLYDGLAALAMIGQLVIHDQLDQISPSLLFASLKDAVEDIQFGVAGLAASAETLPELGTILAGLFGPPYMNSNLDTIFDFEFAFPTVSTNEFQQELVEAAVINTIGFAINEPTDPPAWLPDVPLLGIQHDEYVLRFNATTLDLDIFPLLVP